MRLISGIADQWLGLCRKPPAVHALQTGFGFPPEPVCAGQPVGGGGGSGTLRRGIGAALSGMRTLNRNRQLLWFALLAGLVLAGNTIGQAALSYIDRIMQPDIIVLYVQDFLLGFATLFCLVFLLGGLVLSISSKKEGPASLFEGLCGAKKYLKAIFLWSLVLALAGMLLERIYVYFTIIWFPHELGFLYTIGDGFFISTITQFPFNWTLDWNMLTEIPGYGGRSLLLLIYPFGFLETLHFSAITLLLTPFVVPLIVLEHKTIREAVVGSFAMMKKTWAGVAACALFLGVIVFGVFLTYLLLQAASGMVSPYETVTFHPPDTWIALALLYNLGLSTFAFIVATVGGIAVRDLYISAKTGQIPGSPEKSRELN
ncbi:MAG: hypothetical protein NTW33_01105 [Methanoregula sp.]|nr:hypothetical protein [Methanoregula sp.]